MFHSVFLVPFVGLLNPHRLFLKKPYVAAGMVSMSGDRHQEKIDIRLSVLFQPGEIPFNSEFLRFLRMTKETFGVGSHIYNRK